MSSPGGSCCEFDLPPPAIPKAGRKTGRRQEDRFSISITASYRRNYILQDEELQNTYILGKIDVVICPTIGYNKVSMF
jgi:hypothetical protein